MRIGLAVLIALLLTTTIEARPRRHRARSLTMHATAYSDRGKTAAGTRSHEGIAAADPAVLPLGSRVRVTGAGAWSGIYVITDKGSAIHGREIDLFIASRAEAKRFGNKTVRVTILHTGDGVEDARLQDGH